MLRARTLLLVLGFFLLVGCVPEDTKPRQIGHAIISCAAGR